MVTILLTFIWNQNPIVAEEIIAEEMLILPEEDWPQQ